MTKEKQESLTPYEDRIEEDILFWEGEKGHGTDARIAARDDEVHVFYRERHHTDFTYEGRAHLQTFRLLNDRPSKFVFELLDRKTDISPDLEAPELGPASVETETQAIIAARLGQGAYRRRVISLWKSCSLTGFTNERMLVASHIKPWRISTSAERLDPHNSLLLVPTADALFDMGYIGFDAQGVILLSDSVGAEDWQRIGINRGLKLRFLPEGTHTYLTFHREYIFDVVQE